MNYLETTDFFTEPKVTQHASHMVMSGVVKPLKKKQVNIDTRFSDDYNLNQNGSINILSNPQQPVANYNLTLPERVTEIRSMTVNSVEFPKSFFNVSANLGNNTLTLVCGASSLLVRVPDGQYGTLMALTAALNAQLTVAPFSNVIFGLSANGMFCTITTSSLPAPLTVVLGALPQGMSKPCSERYPLTNTVASLGTAAALTAPITMRPEEFYTSSQRTQRQAAAAQSLKSALPATSSLRTTVNTTSSNSNLFKSVLDMDAVPFCLGWLLGFRNFSPATLSFTVPASGSMTGTAFVDLNGPRYLYVTMDDFCNGPSNGMRTLLKTSRLQKTVLARVTLPFEAALGSVIHCNMGNGLLVADLRTYLPKTDLQRMNVQLVNELGVPMNLNGLGFSLCLEVEHE